MKVKNPIFKSLGLAALTLGAIVIFAYYYVTAGGRLPAAKHLYTITAEVQDPQGLLKHADVRAAGVKVGSVANINNLSTAGGTVALVQMQLNSDIAPVYKDATVLIRQKTLVGENYVELTRGLPKYGQVPDGGSLPLKQDLGAVPLDKILNSLTAPVREKVQGDFQALGNGFKGQGNSLNQFLGQLQPTVHNAGRTLTILNGQKQQISDLIAQTGTVMQALANRTTDLRDLITGGEQTAQAVAARDQALETSLAELPGTLSQARTSVAKLSGFSGTAAPVIGDLKVAMTKLRPVVNDLGPTAASAKTLFAELPGFLKVANPLLSKLTSFSNAATPAVPSLSALLRQATPALDYLKPYYQDVGALLQNFGSGLMQETATGDYIGRCLCPVSAESYTGWTPAEQKLVQALIKAGGLGTIANPNWNALRKPGTAPDASGTFSGTYPRLAEAPPVSLKK